MKTHRTKEQNYIDVKVMIPGGKGISYHISSLDRSKLDSFLKKLDISKNGIDSWSNSKPWEEIAKDRIDKYKKTGLVLRGARYRENMSQVELAKKSHVNQNEISKIENGKRTVGEKVAKRLAKSLHIDYKLLIE